MSDINSHGDTPLARSVGYKKKENKSLRQFKMMDTLKWRSLCSQERQLRSDNCNGQVRKEDLRDDLSFQNVPAIDHV